MKLADYLHMQSMTPSQFRRMLGGIDRATMWRWVHQERVPRSYYIRQIEELTGGQVRREDFLDRSRPKCFKRVRLPDGRALWVSPWSDLYQLDRADDPPPPSSAGANDCGGLSGPLWQALRVLGPARARFTSSGVFLLDGRACDVKDVVWEANKILQARGEPPIFYPGVESLHD